MEHAMVIVSPLRRSVAVDVIACICSASTYNKSISDKTNQAGRHSHSHADNQTECLSTRTRDNSDLQITTHKTKNKERNQTSPCVKPDQTSYATTANKWDTQLNNADDSI